VEIKQVLEDSVGAKIVRADFNPNGHALVNEAKNIGAHFINFVQEYKDLDPRLAAIATTTIEEACMWAVKLVTMPKS
jgi:hypothetical protein